MLVSPYIRRFENSTGIRYFTAIVDVFVNPNIKDNGSSTTGLIRVVLNAVLDELERTMGRKGSEISMPTALVCHNKDEFAKRGILELDDIHFQKNGPTATVFPGMEQDEDPGAKIAGRHSEEYTSCTCITGKHDTADALTTRLEKIYQKFADGKLSKDKACQKEAAAFDEFWSDVEARPSGNLKSKPKAKPKPSHKPKKKG